LPVSCPSIFLPCSSHLPFRLACAQTFPTACPPLTSSSFLFSGPRRASPSSRFPQWREHGLSFNLVPLGGPFSFFTGTPLPSPALFEGQAMSVEDLGPFSGFFLGGGGPPPMPRPYGRFFLLPPFEKYASPSAPVFYVPPWSPFFQHLRNLLGPFRLCVYPSCFPLTLFFFF